MKYRVSQNQKSTMLKIAILRIMQYINVNILSHGTYNFHLDVCKVSIQYVIRLCINLAFDSLSPV